MMKFIQPNKMGVQGIMDSTVSDVWYDAALGSGNVCQHATDTD